MGSDKVLLTALEFLANHPYLCLVSYEQCLDRNPLLQSGGPKLLGAAITSTMPRFGSLATQPLAVPTATGWWTGSKAMKESQVYTKTFSFAVPQEIKFCRLTLLALFLFGL